MKYSTRDLMENVLVTCPGSVEEFILEICMMLTLSSVVSKVLMLLLGVGNEDGLGVELLIPIAAMIYWIRNLRGQQWKQAMIMAMVVGLAMLPKILAFLRIKNPLNEAIRTKLNPNPSRSRAYGMGTKLSLQ